MRTFHDIHLQTVPSTVDLVEDGDCLRNKTNQFSHPPCFTNSTPNEKIRVVNVTLGTETVRLKATSQVPENFNAGYRGLQETGRHEPRGKACPSGIESNWK